MPMARALDGSGRPMGATGRSGNAPASWPRFIRATDPIEALKRQLRTGQNRKIAGWLRAGTALGAVLAVTLGWAGSAAARTPLTSCSAYPRPGTVGPAGTPIPAAILRRYGIFRGEPRRDDVLSLGRLQSELPAAGIVSSGTRYLGRSGDHGKLYAIPAAHYLPYPLEPLRCLPAGQRRLERYLRASLVMDYNHVAVCVAEVGGDDLVATPLEACGPLSGPPDAVLATGDTPLLGLAPDDVSAVTASYLSSPPQTVKVRHNFYEVVDPALGDTPCDVDWLDASGNVARSFGGCDYLPSELPALREYRSYVASELSVVDSDVSALAGAIGAGNFAEARSTWLTAHLAWLAIGQDDGAYGCFGELGGEIDGTSAGLVDGTSSPDFTGFHKIELDLWTDDDLTAAATDTSTLEQLLAQLVAIPLTSELPGNPQGLANWVLRPHEILEDALRDTLTGNDDYGSGTGLASLTSDVAATKELLTFVAPTLDPLAPDLMARAEGDLQSIMAAVDSTQVNGAWVAVSALPTGQREKVDAAVDATLETLAPVPDLLTSTGTSAPPT